MSWSKLKLGELTRIRTGKLDANAADKDGKYPFFTCAVEPLLINTPAFDCKAVLVAGNGDLNVKYHEGKFNAYQRTYVIESIDENKLYPKYLYYFLNDYIVELRELSIGGVIKYIKLGNLTDAKILLPPLAEQKRIATVLDKAEEIKSKRKKEITKLDELAQSTFIEMFGDFMRVKERINLQDLIEEFRYGTSNKSSDSGHPALRIPNIAYGSLNLTELKTVKVTAEEFKRLKLINGDLLFVRTNGNREYVGRCVVFNPIDVEKYAYDSNSYIYASYLIRARLKKNVIQPIVLQEFLSTAEGKEALRSRCKTSAGQFNINTEGLGSIPIPIFPKPLEERFILIKKSIAKQKLLCQRGMREINKTIISLEQQAFTTGFNA